MHVVDIALKNLDSAVKYWFDVNDPYKYKSVPTKWNTEKVIPLCPICEAEMKHDEDYMEHIKMEDHVRCPNHHYYCSYVTGSTETVIGSVVVQGHYADSEEVRMHQSRLINLAIIHEREEWKKHGK